MVLLEAFGANVHIVRRSSASYRRLQLYGSDGRVRHMLVQTGQNWSQNSTDERVVQLMRLINRLLEAHPQARSRGLALHTPLLVTCWPQVSGKAKLRHVWVDTALTRPSPSFVCWRKRLPSPFTSALLPPHLTHTHPHF